MTPTYILIVDGRAPAVVTGPELLAAYPAAPIELIEDLPLRGGVYRGDAWSVRRTRYLVCAVCSQNAGHWAQHDDRDDGWGLCEACALRLPASGTTAEEMARCYGIAGVNYAIVKSEPRPPAPAIVKLGDVHLYPHTTAAWKRGDATWFEIAESRYMDALEVLPPIYFPGGFFVSEAIRHDDGVPVYLAIAEWRGSGAYAMRYFAREVRRDRIEAAMSDLRKGLAQ